MTTESEPQLPEAPFDGVVVSRDVVSNPKYSSSMGAYVSLLIIPEVDLKSEAPRLVQYDFAVSVSSSYVQPLRHLRPGHRVRVKQVRLQLGVVLANELALDPASFTAPFLKDENPA